MFLAKFRSPAFPHNEEMTRIVIVRSADERKVIVSHLHEPKRKFVFEFNKCYVSIIEGVKVRLK